jgi:hypothetical protein
MNNSNNSKENKIKDALNAVEPDKAAQERIYDNIIDCSKLVSVRAPRRNLFASAAALAACAVIAVSAIFGLPLLARMEMADPGGENSEFNQGNSELAPAYDDVRIFVGLPNGAIGFRTVHLRLDSEVIIAKWEELNGAEPGSVSVRFDWGGVEEWHGDPNDPDSMVSWTPGELSLWLDEFPEGANVEALSMTLYEQYRQNGITWGMAGIIPALHEFTYTRTARPVEMLVSDVSAAGLTYAFDNRVREEVVGYGEATFGEAFSLYLLADTGGMTILDLQWWNLSQGLAVNDIIHIIPGNGASRMLPRRLDFTAIFGEGGLPEGVYRFVKAVDDYERSFYFAIGANGESRALPERVSGEVTFGDEGDGLPSVEVGVSRFDICEVTGERVYFLIVCSISELPADWNCAEYRVYEFRPGDEFEPNDGTVWCTVCSAIDN